MANRWDRFANWMLGRSLEDVPLTVPNAQPDQVFIPDWVTMNFPYGSGQGALRYSIVHGCVSLICERLQITPTRILDSDGIAIPGAQPPWMMEPDPRDHGFTWPDIVWMTGAQLLLEGTGYWTYTMHNKRVVSVRVLPKSAVNFRLVNGQFILKLVSQEMPAKNVLVSRLHATPHRARGYSAIEWGRQQMEASYAGDEQIKYANTTGHTIPFAIGSPDMLDDDDIDILRMNWDKYQSGPRNANYPFFFGGDGKIFPISISQRDAQFIQSKKFTDSAIASRFFHIEPSMLGLPAEASNLTYENLEMRETSFVMYGCKYVATRIEEMATRILPPGQSFHMDLESTIKVDRKSRFEVYQMGLKNRIYTVNDVRRMEGLPPIEGGDELQPPQPQPPQPGETQDEPPVEDVP